MFSLSRKQAIALTMVGLVGMSVVALLAYENNGARLYSRYINPVKTTVPDILSNPKSYQGIRVEVPGYILETSNGYTLYETPDESAMHIKLWVEHNNNWDWADFSTLDSRYHTMVDGIVFIDVNTGEPSIAVTKIYWMPTPLKT